MSNTDQPTPAPLLPWRPIKDAPTAHGTKIMLCQDGHIRYPIKYQAYGVNGWFNECGHRVRIGHADMFIVPTPPAEGLEVREMFAVTEPRYIPLLVRSEKAAQEKEQTWNKQHDHYARACRATVVTTPLNP